MNLLCVTSHRDTLSSVRPEAELFIGLRERGLNVTVMTQRDSPYVDRMTAAGISVVDFTSRGKLDWQAIGIIRQALKRDQFNRVFGFNGNVIANINIAARGLPVGVVAYRGQTDNMSRFSPRSYLLHLNPRVDLVCAVANAVRDYLRDQHYDPTRVETLYKGHDIRWYQEEPVPRSELGVPENAFVVGCVANHRPRKGLSVLIEAMSALPDDTNVHLLLVGAGQEDLTRVVAQSPAARRIHLLGFRRDAPAVIAACDCSVLPALRREGLPKTVIESMAHGVVPVVTDTGGNAELVEHGVSGLVVQPGDAQAIAQAIESLCGDPAVASSLGSQAQVRIRDEFNVDRSVNRAFELLTAFPTLTRFDH